jgi:acyl-coenzyme A synthetase/AMP-(fatty) acid ligase
VAFVVPSDPSLDPTEVMGWVAERVAPYKKIRALHVIDAVPKSPSGKILRKDLRLRLADGQR